MIKYKNALIFVGLFILTQSCGPKVNHLAYTKERTYRIDEKHSASDLDIESMIAPYREDLNKTMNVVIAQSKQEIYKEKPNSALLNFMADMLLDGAKSATGREDIDIAVQNYGGIRVSSLPKGKITTGNIFELMPFENTLVILEVPGYDMKLLLDRIADYGGWPISRGSSFKIVDETYADSIYINNLPFEIDKTYTLALPDYIANGGDKSNFFKKCKRTDTGVLIRDLIIDQLKELGEVPINHEKRIF